MNPERKTCRKCGEPKAIDDFYRKRATRDGRSSACKACEAEQRRKAGREWAQRNKDSMAEYRKEYRKRPENRERERETSRRWKAANRDRGRASTQRWRDDNWETFLASSRASKRRIRAADPETHRAESRQWYRDNPEKALRMQRAAHARRRALVVTDADLDYMELISRDPCAYCNGPAGSIDHIDAVTRGGKGDWSNLASACMSCNQSKYTRPLLVFMVERYAQ